MARPWYPWYPGDYARATAHLTFAEDAAYRRLLDHYYSTGKLPANAEILLRICRAISCDEQTAVAKVAAEFFREEDGFLVQDRAAAEINKSLYLSGIRSDAGKRGADKTNSKSAGKTPATDAANMPANTPAIADTTTTTTTSSKQHRAASPHGVVAKGEPEGFNTFWSVYPRKVARQEAVKAWQKLNPDAGLQQGIFNALANQTKSEQWRRDAGKFIPHPGTWLNGRRWEDQAPPAGTNNGTDNATFRGAV
jgi:uncharacterized protein YdaU (DUF1376 family)